jgi:hypothetical protein
MQIERPKTKAKKPKTSKRMKYTAIDIRDLSPIFNGMEFNIIDDFAEEMKNDALEIDKRQPPDRMLRACIPGHMIKFA